MSETALTPNDIWIEPPSFGRLARRDLLTAFSNWYVWIFLGWLDIRQRYRRSALGPLWLTVSMGVTVAALGTLYSKLFHISDAELVPWLSVSFIIWGFISTTLTEACHCFITAEGLIKQVQIPISIQPLRVVWRNLIIMGHNLLILPFVYVVYGMVPNWNLLLVVPGIVLIMLNLAWLALLTGMVCTRFRDLPQLVNSVIQIAFYVTPIIWKPSVLPPQDVFLLQINPFFHLMALMREPMLGRQPSLLSWVFGIGCVVVGAGLTLIIYGRFHRRVSYWL